MPTLIVLDTETMVQIKSLIELAEACPVDMQKLMTTINTPDGKERHMTQMTRQTIRVPMHYMLTFSIEHGHPCGTCRHMSVSDARHHIPAPDPVWHVAKEFGFWGTLGDCSIWQEHLAGHGYAVNLVQPLTHG